MIKDNELSVLEIVPVILKPLSYLTDALACVKQITASGGNPVVKHLTRILTVDDIRDTTLAIQIKETIWTDLEDIPYMGFFHATKFSQISQIILDL